VKDKFTWESPSGKWYIEAVTTLPVRGLLVKQEGDWFFEIPWFRYEKGKIDIEMNKNEIPDSIWNRMLNLAEQAALEAHITGPAFVMD
jgi:hypothetical protein